MIRRGFRGWEVRERPMPSRTGVANVLGKRSEGKHFLLRGHRVTATRLRCGARKQLCSNRTLFTKTGVCPDLS